MNVIVKTSKEIDAMREGGKRLVQILDKIKKNTVPGITLKKLDDIAIEESKRLGGSPSFLGYHGFSGAICASVNEGIVHCIPDEYILKEGDLLSIDCGLYYQGMHTDSCISYIVGNDIHNYTPLLKAVYASLVNGTNTLKDGVKVGEISKAIEDTLNNANLTIMRQFTGHGVGKNLHEEPIVPNFVSHDKNVVLKSGNVIAIEPLAGIGSESSITAKDGWSVTTIDKKAVAHFEHTVLITQDGYEILTPIHEIIDIKA